MKEYSNEKLKNTARIVEGNHLINNCSWKPLGGMSKWKLVGKIATKNTSMMNGWKRKKKKVNDKEKIKNEREMMNMIKKVKWRWEENLLRDNIKKIFIVELKGQFKRGAYVTVVPSPGSPST